VDAKAKPWHDDVGAWRVRIYPAAAGFAPVVPYPAVASVKAARPRAVIQP